MLWFTSLLQIFYGVWTLVSFFVNGFLTLMGNEQKDLAEKKELDNK